MPYGNKLTWIGYPPFEGIRSKQGKHHPHKDIRSMSVAFDMRDDNGNDESENGGRWMVRYLVRRYHDTYYGDGAFDRLSSPERQVVIHDVQLKRLTDITWGDYAGSMHDFDLDFLQIDFSRCYCPIGCHRMAVEATKILFHFYPGRPKEIEILGAISLWEQNKISEVILKAEEPWNPGLVFTKIKWSDYLDDFEYDPQEDIGDIDLP
ncbi:MAG: hypothetical protein M1830_010187 [Pleopsidium flavum]|nr:MAG: hypothetical protein M1830_010187 [Pleopsidium flavum]